MLRNMNTYSSPRRLIKNWEGHNMITVSIVFHGVNAGRKSPFRGGKKSPIPAEKKKPMHQPFLSLKDNASYICRADRYSEGLCFQVHRLPRILSLDIASVDRLSGRMPLDYH